ncbi:unnamed protein product [Linum trigynum]|uniref:Uncharacterized protein n=1 Tax=Linum trigynum TaxID=586398 RepID=A0AAV2GUP3_9ROSI
MYAAARATAILRHGEFLDLLEQSHDICIQLSQRRKRKGQETVTSPGTWHTFAKQHQQQLGQAQNQSSQSESEVKIQSNLHTSRPLSQLIILNIV